MTSSSTRAFTGEPHIGDNTLAGTTDDGVPVINQGPAATTNLGNANGMAPELLTTPTAPAANLAVIEPVTAAIAPAPPSIPDQAPLAFSPDGAENEYIPRIITPAPAGAVWTSVGVLTGPVPIKGGRQSVSEGGGPSSAENKGASTGGKPRGVKRKRNAIVDIKELPFIDLTKPPYATPRKTKRVRRM